MGGTSQFTIPTVFTAVNKFSGPVQGMMRTINNFANRSQASIAKVERGFRNILAPLRSFNGLLASAGLYIGLYSFVTILRSVVGTIADFEQAQVDIAAVTNSTVKDNKELADNARRLALNYGEAAKSILATDLALIKLGYAKTDAMKATEAIITGSIALKANPDELAKAVGATMMALKMPKGSEKEIVDMYAKAADISALDWGELQTMLPIAQSAAAISGKKLEEILALFAVVRNAQVHVSSGSTAIKNMLIKSGIHGKDYTEMLQSITESPNKIKKAFKLFGPKTLVSALPLAEAQKLGSISELMNRIKTTSPGYASQVASKRLESLNGKFSLLKRTWEEFILSTEDGSGKLSKSLKALIDTGRATLLLASGSDIAKEALYKMNSNVVQTAMSWLFWLDKIWLVIKAFFIAKAIMITANAIMWAGRAAVFAYSVAMGIFAVVNKASAMSLRGNTIALTTFLLIEKLATAATWQLNAAMLTGPVAIFTLAILGVVTAFGLMSNALDNLIPNQRSLNAEMMRMKEIKDSMYGEKKTTIAAPKFAESETAKIDSVLSNVKGSGQYMARIAADSIRQAQLDSISTQRAGEEFWKKSGLTDEGKELLNLKTSRQNNLMDLLNGAGGIGSEKNTLDVILHDKGGNIESVKSSSSSIKPKIKSTFGIDDNE